MENAAGTPQARPTDIASLVQFYIPTTSSLFERRPRTLKHGDTFGLFDHYGDIVGGERSPEGLFHRDTRHLSVFNLTINDRRPLLLSSAVQDDNLMLTVDVTNPDFFDDDQLVLQKDMIHIIRSKFLWNATCNERIRLRNFDSKPQRMRIEVNYAADFADIFEVRGHPRAARGAVSARASGSISRFDYAGLDGLNRRTSLSFAPAPTLIDEEHAVFDVSLEPGARASLFCRVSCNSSEPAGIGPDRRFFACFRQSRRAYRQSASRSLSIETSNPVFDQMINRCVADLTMLSTQTARGPYLYAGIPWFSTPFGRDGVISAIETLWVDPDIARGVLEYLASTQARARDPDADAEPGKILHETRFGELSRLHEVPFERYYGSVDSTPLFILLAGLYFERTGDLETISNIWPALEAALGWIDDNAARSKHRFVTYVRGGKDKLTNQGWKDSADSVFHANGADAQGAIALCEVQGYVYAAKRHAARLAAAIGFEAQARRLDREAKSLAARFESAFWCDEIDSYAMALDGDGEQCRVRSSNAGQLLFSGMIPLERARRLADQMLHHDFFSGWGIRTIPDTESRYNPMSYHNGSVWPHDNALIGLGFDHYGFKSHVLRIFSGLFDAARYMDLQRLPELFCGFRRSSGKGPTFYPVACSPQAWASAAPFALLQASLGLQLDYPQETVRFHQPRLPPFLREVRLHPIRIGNGELDLLIRRSAGGGVSVNVLRRTGDAHVVVRL